MTKRNFILALALLTLVLGIGSCGVTRPVTTITQVVTQVRDSLVIRTDTLVIPVPVESHTTVAEQYSSLETSVATSTAYIDTTGFLHHQLRNKQTSLKREVQYVDRYIETVRDSLVRVEVPVEVEVIKTVTPKWAWRLLAMDVLVLVCCVAFAVFKLKKKLML